MIRDVYVLKVVVYLTDCWINVYVICNIDSSLLIPLFLKETNKNSSPFVLAVISWWLKWPGISITKVGLRGASPWLGIWTTSTEVPDVDTGKCFHWVFWRSHPELCILRKRKAKVWGLCGRMHIVMMWRKGMNSMKNKNPISAKAKSINKAKVEDRLKRKKIGLDDQGWLNNCTSRPKDTA